MKINLKGLSPEQKEKVKTIVTLGQTIGGNEKMDNYLMQQLMNVYMPETDSIDELASLYQLTGEESVKDDLLNEYYTSRGIDPKQRESNNIYSTKFSEDYALDDKKYGDQNAVLQSIMQENPELLAQYYEGTPRPEKFNWGSIGAGAATGAGVGAGAGLAGGPLAGISVPVGAGVGGIVGGIAGLINAISDKNTESDKEKRARLESLVSQYRSNLPNN